ncbi:type I restriction enzyme HsdR N-terminal domain-containing protein [Cytophagaceae bacterium 50C-KIRBA]|uniref:Type I restriction enzyme HsdR N-terminal domain-containing protein n=1 Tax=Aquirufa beregesia TaxID=2516556 RepID=A0ABX0ESP7_9BACT|nr:type I restriction enzyme HsdR N-terminal domain-containing protein [Aquirufa beregesia]NGZ43436.1 type I restriction enzyme HsdR N-terminal domain-containing protein [Aquirufa beregesia]
MMQPIADLTLQFPPYDYKLKKKDGKLYIFDPIAKKYRLLSPEEWVRQHCLQYITSHLHYPCGMIQIEGGISINQLQRRSDIQIFAKDGTVFMIIECKAPHVKLTEVTWQQISQYQKQINSKYLVLTNGLETKLLEIDLLHQKTNTLTQFPIYS